jgi:hypothetical protein
MSSKIIGDGKRKSRYNPDLGKEKSAEYEEKERERKEAVEALGIEGLDKICQNFKDYLTHEEWDIDEDWPNLEGLASEVLGDMTFISKQIEGFCKVLPGYKSVNEERFEGAVGNYLSTLVGQSQDKEFVLDLREAIATGMDLYNFLCELEDKKVTVYGDVADAFGFMAKNCEFILYGNARDQFCEDAKKCTVTVNGNVRSFLGEGAKNCEFHINGDVSSGIGPRGDNCKIWIEGNIVLKGNLDLETGPISKNIGKGTEIYQEVDGNWERIHPR